MTEQKYGKGYRLKKIAFVFFAMTLFAACSLVTKKHSTDPIDSQLKSKWDAELTSAEKKLEDLQFVEAEEQFSKFETENGYSIYSSRSKIGHARALAGQGKHHEAIQLYQEVMQQASISRQLSGLAAYYASFSYEALGDDSKTLATLQDALGFSDSLPIEVAKAELPARLAAYYNRIDEKTLSAKYYHQAERGVEVLFKSQKEQKAKSFYAMGILNSNQTSRHDILKQIETLELLQIFSLRAVETGSTKWGQLAFENLQNNYRDIWNAIMLSSNSKSTDTLGVQASLWQEQKSEMERLLEAINKIKSFRITDKSTAELEQNLFVFLDSIEVEAIHFLQDQPELRFTKEAQQRNALKKSGKLVPVEPSKKERQ